MPSSKKTANVKLRVIASGLDRPNGLAFYKGTLYIAEGTKISKLENIEDNLENPPKPVVIYSDFLNHQSHGWKFMGLGPDNKLYVNVGSPCNICEPPATNGQIRRINLDGSGAEIAARGVRNSVGFDWHPVTKELYFTDNGRDWLSEDLPEDELNRVTKVGQHFGFPYCHQGNFTDREIGLGSLLRRVRETGRPARAALGRARHALLHRQNVSEPIPERDLHRAPRLLEPDQEDRRRCHRREAEQGRQRKIAGAVSHRLSAEQRIQRPAGRRAGDERWIAAGFRRSRRRGLSRDLRQRQGRYALSEVSAPNESSPAICPNERLPTSAGAHLRYRYGARLIVGIAGQRRRARREARRLSRLPRRQRPIGHSRGAIPRRATGFLPHDSVAHVPRQTARRRTDEPGDARTHG